MTITKISRSLLDTGVSDSSDATAITIDSSENVGIGTSSPQGNLHVEGAAGASGGGIIYVTDADNGSTASDALHISKSGDTAFVYNRESSGDLQLGAGNTSGHVVIKSSGNCGIGTTSPTYTLDVLKDSQNGTIAQFGGDGGDGSFTDVRIRNTHQASSSINEGARLIFELGSTNAGWIEAFKEADGTSAGNRTGGLAFHTTASNSTTEKMRIASGGALTLANSGVSAASYTNSSITVDAKGRVTAASSGSAGASTGFVIAMSIAL